ncbi:MAG TPA: triose-phosphate isomerase [Chloroflexi bacterium]|nr:triose-phosphate isomerase [Chloroflexota bacterium]
MMNKKNLIVANWKMNLKTNDGVKLVQHVLDNGYDSDVIEVVICPSFLSLEAINRTVTKSPISVGAQNIFWIAGEGPYTGEVSSYLISGVCDYVIIGHSERRTILNEDDVLINKKVVSAIENDIVPIICVGETETNTSESDVKSMIFEQIAYAYDGISDEDAINTVIAYEPSWAIGTGNNNDSEVINRVCLECIRGGLNELYDSRVSNLVRTIYGGSVTGSIVSEIVQQEFVDGVLVGGASLSPDGFLEILRNSY